MKRFTQYLVENPIRSNGVVVVFGQFNPPTISHESLFLIAKSYKPEYDFLILVSHKQDQKKNPLDYDTKIKYLKAMYPEFSPYIKKDNYQNIFKALESLQYEYENLIFITSANRINTFENEIMKRRKNTLRKFKSIQIPTMTSIAADPDYSDVIGYSSSKMQSFVLRNDFNSFKMGLPVEFRNKLALELFKDLQKAMQPKAKLKTTNVREQFFAGKLFTCGEKVHSLSKKISGKIDYIGSNYVIVESNGIKSRHWITDIKKEK